MNKFITAVKTLDLLRVKALLQKEPQWTRWAEDNGKNALHYLCAREIGKDPDKMELSLQILKALLKAGMDIDSIHAIPDDGGSFPATPLWYAYAKGRNEKLFTWLLKNGANPDHCMFALAWNDDVRSAALFKKHGAKINELAGIDTPFLGAWNWRRFHIAEWFLKNGADVDRADSSGDTALFLAVKRKYKLEQIKILLQYGADPDKKNREGLSPRMLATQNNQRNIGQLFNER
jgi:hypothetical protein